LYIWIIGLDREDVGLGIICGCEDDSFEKPLSMSGAMKVRL
jgi:hypothetical protein